MTVYNYIMTHPLPIALFGAYFIPFALVGFAVVFCRMIGRKMQRTEFCLFLLFVVLVVMEWIQLSATGRSFDRTADFRGVSRYFGVLAPFIWIFAARGAAFFWKHPNRTLNRLGRVGLVLALGWVLVKDNWTGIFNYKTKLQSYDTEVAIARLAPKIKEDYLGPRKQYPFKRTLEEYFSGRRPVVSSPFGAASWAVNGDHCRTTGVMSPYQEDYLCFPLGSGYAGITTVDASVYQFVASAPGGLGTLWMLYRRRTTPGRAK